MQPCEYVTFVCQLLATVSENASKCECFSTFSIHVCGCSDAWHAHVHVQLCTHVRAPHQPHGTPLSFCSFGSGGNVTLVTGIAAILDPGNSDDRNRHLLPLQHTHCLATGSPHTFPKPFSQGVIFDRCHSCSRSFSSLHMHILSSSSV